VTIRFVEDIYADFLYDCYIANQRLTDEDWEWYGREEHHIELPERDGGVLTPLNSQVLTTYQHWIAGALQSEILGKCCFACVPKGKLPPMFELLRDKWQREYAKERYAETGHKISNRGKMWVTDGIEQKMIHRGEPIPVGWKKGRLPHTDETRRKISEIQKGRDTSHMLRAREGLLNPWLGRKHSEESKEKMRQAKLRRRHNA
jgi:hypothetical protein